VYSPRLTAAKLKAFVELNHWEPVPHTIEQIKEFTAYLAAITTTDQNSKNGYIRITKRLTEERLSEIKRFIQNEQILCTVDEGYWSERYAYICDEKGDIFQFKNRKSQEIFDVVVAHFDELEVAIELFVLKARQLGISTRVALKFLHRMLFMPNTQAIMSSVNADKSELIGRIINICYERCPWWLVPRQTANRVGKMIEFENSSILSIQSGMQPTGIAQGWTPTLVHISEIGDIPNPKKVLEEGLLRATHPSRKLFQVWEGTGNGNTGWQADKWRALKEAVATGEPTRFFPLFLPWPLATDLYPEADWLKKFPVPSSWEPMPETKKHVRKCEFYIRSTPFLAGVVGTDWKMPRTQQWFWEVNYKEAEKSRTQRVWLSQMPADDTEALTGKNDLVFDQEVIEVVTETRAQNYTAYAIVGNSIDEGFEPPVEEIDYNLPRIPIHWESHRGMKYDWLLIPLRPISEADQKFALDKVMVFEPPKHGRDYSAGIDTADGLNKEDSDRSVLNITQSAKGNYPDIQCAEFVSIRVNPAQMVGFAACLASWYGPSCRDPRGVKFCIEQRERPGDDCQHQLKLMGFTFHHEMVGYDGKVVKEQSNKQGWYSNAWSVPFMMNRFIEAVVNGWYIPNSKWLIAELQDLERKITGAGKTKLEHQSGKHDDRVRAAAQAYITRHHMDTLAERSKKKYAVNHGELPPLDELALQYAQSSRMSVGD